MPKVSDAYLAKRREEILAGARRCFSRYGYEGATVRRLEKEVGLSRGAIFNYFPSKWELFQTLTTQDYERSPESWAGGGFEEQARSLLEEDRSWLGVQIEFLRQLRTDPKLRRQWTERLPDGRRRVVESLRDGQRDGEFRSDVSAEGLRAFLSLILDGLVLQASLGVEVDLDEVLKLVDDAVKPMQRSPLAFRHGGARGAANAAGHLAG